MGNIRIPIEANKIYHIFNHAVGNENLFRKEDNFVYFLKKYHEHISPIADTFAYCLMPNHFHILLRMKNEDELLKYYNCLNLDPTGFQNPSGVLTKLNSHKFGNFFNAYTKAYNKMFDRKGKLYQAEFNRRWVHDDEYFRKMVHYIHTNPVHHNFVKDLSDWKFSSYESFFSVSISNLKREEVIELFDSLDNFIAFHKRDIDDKMYLDLESI